MLNLFKTSFKSASSIKASTYTLQKTIRRELESLNQMIDAKIMKGISYAAEAHRHKALLYRLYNLQSRF